MRRRSKAGGKTAKSQRRKATTLKRRNAPKAMRDRGVSISGQETKVTRLERDLNEAWEQQTATSEILKIISSLPTSVQAVLDTVVASAARLCQALNATIYLRDGDVAVIHAQFGYGGSPVGTRRPLDADWVTGRAVLETRTIHVPDLLNSDEYPKARGISLPLGYRALLAVPLMRNKTAVGAILATRREARPFTDRQIALLQNFADQAVIAIENTRLLNELRQRTTDLTESLEEQTATSEVLRVISSSPGELKLCSRPCSQVLCASARPPLGTSCSMMARVITRRICITFRRAITKSGSRDRYGQTLNLLLVGSRTPSKPFKSQISRLSRVTVINCASPPSNLGAPERYWPSPCLRKISSLVPSSSTARKCVRLPINRLR